MTYKLKTCKFKCPKCGEVLFEYAMLSGMFIEIKCPKCKEVYSGEM